MQNKTYSIISFGEILWDCYPDHQTLGGAPTNLAIRCQRSGIETLLISAIGNDSLGNKTLQVIDRYHLHALLPRTSSPTGTVSVLLRRGIPEYTIASDCAWDHIPIQDTMIDAVSHADAFCFGTLAIRSPSSLQTIKQLISAIASPNPILFCDINLRQNFYTKSTIEFCLHHCNILKLNDEELSIITNLFSLPAKASTAARLLINQFHIHTVILTSGDDGSTIYTSKDMSHICAVPVEVIDTVGAGDAFSASFLVSHLRGIPLAEAHSKAALAAAEACTHYGAV